MVWAPTVPSACCGRRLVWCLEQTFQWKSLRERESQSQVLPGSFLTRPQPASPVDMTSDSTNQCLGG